jgi:hypothetical protein
MDREERTQNGLRLSAADFDVFLGASGRARGELRQRALTWANGVVERLAELGLAVQASAAFGNDGPSPALRLFFWRDARSRGDLARLIDHKKTLAAALAGPATDHTHAILHALFCLKIDSARVEVSFEVHPDAWVDARNLRARLAEPEGALELTSAIEELPEEFALGLASGMMRRPAREASPEIVRELVARSAVDRTPMWVGWTVLRAVAVRHSAQLDALLEGAIVALGPVYKLVAWAPDNDLLVVGRDWEAQRAARARARARDDAERERWPRPKPKGRSKRAPEEPEPRSRGVEAAPREDAAPSVPPPRSAPPAAADRGRLRTSARERPTLRRTARPALRSMPRAGRALDVDPHAPIEKGTRVHVLSGPFVGRVGTVQDLDGKGHARVLLGLLATRVPLTELIATANGKGGGALASSHRKPQ